VESSGNNGNKNKWHFIDSGFKTGEFNMSFDLELVENCKATGDSYLRFYRWKPYAISLGYIQSKAPNHLELDMARCSADNIDVVQRPTGGRAVLHSEELTYSVVMKSAKPIREVYKDISTALLYGLKNIDPANRSLLELSFANENPDLVKLMKAGNYNLCFNSQVKYEINHRGRKLVGSAQRKFGDIVLQHGSVLIGPHHKSIVDYVSASEESKDSMRKDLSEKTVCLNDLLGREITYSEVGDAIFRGFKSTFEIDFSSINRLASLIDERTSHTSVYN